MGFFKPDPPPAPDYAGAAREQGVANAEAARASAKLSNPNFNNPYGSQRVTYGINGDPDQVQVDQTLSPVGRQLFDQDNRIKTGLGNIAEGGIDRVGGMLGSQFDMSNVTDRPDLNDTLSRDQMTQSIIDRNQPMMDRRRQQLATQLANQGITLGSEAHKNAQDDFAREENDFRLSAIQAGGAEQSRQYGIESDARGKDIQTEAYLRQLPLNEINALRSSSQVVTPQFQPYQGKDIAPAPIFGATQAQGQADIARYNADSAGSTGMMNGLFGLGGAALMAPMTGGTSLGGMLANKMISSDIRLKENIRRVGATDAGLPVYTYNYIGNPTPHMGVMAQEVQKVMPEAVGEHESGYLMVDYSKVK